MRKLSLLLLLPLLLLASCSPHDDSSSTSETNPFDNYYQAADQDLTYYDISKNIEMDSVPSIGHSKLLVIPVVIEGYEANATSIIREKITQVMFGQSDETSWESVSSFYAKSSYGKLTLDGTVTEWYESGYSSSEIDNMATRGRDPVAIVLDEAIEWVKTSQTGIDLTDYDVDQDGHIDAVWLVYSAPSQLSDTFWAYVYWSFQNQNVRNLASPTPYAYAWASYDFMYEGYGQNGIDAHTYIHETGHLLGLDDYYDYDNESSPMGAIDMMDNNIIDHNGYSKFALGWTNPFVVTGDADIELLPASTSGQVILLANEWNGSPFDEYLLIELYTPDGLNQKDSDAAYPGNNVRGFTVPGIRMYHVDTRLFNPSTNEYVDSLADGVVIGAHNSESWSNLSQFKSSFKLLSLVDAAKNTRYLSSPLARASNNTLFKTGSSFVFNDYKSAFPRGSKNTMNDGSSFPFTIEFTNVNSTSAQVKIRVA